MKQARESNIELLRIVAMLMITLGHYVIHGLWHSSFSGGEMLSSGGWLFTQNLIFSLCVVGVNLFVLISGFFRIKLTWSRLVAYVLMCITYNLMRWMSHSIVIGTFDMHQLACTVVVTKTFNWFFKSYWWLLLASPILNRAFEHFSVRDSRVTILLLTILNCMSGFVFCYENISGFGPAHLMFIYSIGIWLKKESENKALEKLSWRTSLSVYLLLSVLSAALAAVNQVYPHVNVSKIYAYNNPMIIISSITLFLAFRSIRLESKLINKVAASVVGVLFLQEVVLNPWTYTFIRRRYEAVGDGIMIVAWIMVVMVLLWIIGWTIEYIRKWITKPVSQKISSFLDNIIPLFP